jgi:hypothetical protein
LTAGVQLLQALTRTPEEDAKVKEHYLGLVDHFMATKVKG